MYLKCIERCRHSVGTARKVILAVGFLAGALGASTTAIAQTTQNIHIDLSVFDDDARLGRPSTANFPTVPPVRAPISTLHIAPKKQIKLRAPAASQKSTSEKLAQKSDPKPAQKKVARKPVSKPQPLKIAKAATPKAAPSSPIADLTKSVPPPPPLVTAPATRAPKVASAPPAAPEVAKSPPPTAAKPKSSAPEVASTPAKIEMKPGRALRIAFGDTETRLPNEYKVNLLNLANAVREEKGLRLQVLAYAGGQDLSTSKARRMSLSRALAVRAFLIDKGVRSTQIDVRALGSKTNEKPVNRIDLNLTKR